MTVDGGEARRGSELLARRKAARVPLQPRRRVPDLGPRPRGRRSGPRDVVSDRGLRLHVVAGRRARSSSPPTSFPSARDTACLERTLKARAGGEGQGTDRRAPALSATGTPGRTERARTSGRLVPASGPGAVDLTPGDRDAPPFQVGGGVDWTVSPDGRELVFTSNHDPIEARLDQRRSLRSCRSRAAAPRNLTAAEPRLRRLARATRPTGSGSPTAPRSVRGSSRTASASCCSSARAERSAP